MIVYRGYQPRATSINKAGLFFYCSMTPNTTNASHFRPMRTIHIRPRQRAYPRLVDIHHNPLVLGTVVRPPPHVRLDDVVAVQEGQLAVGLNPELEPGVLSEDVQGRYRQAELSRLCELAYSGWSRLAKHGEAVLSPRV